jgi:hypothetical protein
MPIYTECQVATAAELQLFSKKEINSLLIQETVSVPVVVFCFVEGGWEVGFWAKSGENFRKNQ